MKRTGRFWGWTAGWLLAVGLAGSALGQQPGQQQPQQQRDPFGGRFGVIEIAPTPTEAARDAQLLSEQLSGLAPQRPGQLDTYVLAASLWGDPVFEREASQAADILKRHFAAEGRTIILSAGGEPGERRYPSASPYQLAAAMGRLGQVIDPAEDLVVLFLTSHGSPDGSIALKEGMRMQAAMRPAHLREALENAGIRNRVVIVSACFSGAFIAPLMTDRTVVLTAAAPDRTSFGCQPDREWTFFGDAFFNHAVRDGGSLLSAFDRSKTLIAQWEQERGLTPSNPQRFVGARAASLLAQAEQAGAAATP